MTLNLLFPKKVASLHNEGKLGKSRSIAGSSSSLLWFCGQLTPHCSQEIIKVREWIPLIGPLTKVIHLNLFLDIVPSSSTNFTRAIFPRRVFSWRKQRRRVMADRASSKRKFEVSNAPSNQRKKTSPNLSCRKERTWTLCDRNKIENLPFLDCTRSYAAIMCVLF